MYFCQYYVEDIVFLYTEEPKITKTAIEGLLAYVIVSFPFEYLVNLLMGYISGVGVQESVTIPTILCYSLVSLPSSYIFTFYYHQGIKGLFYGCALGDFVLCIIYLHLISTIDMEQQVANIQDESMEFEKPQFDFPDDKQSLLTIEDNEE